jgi:predicted lipoprotein with Yx(FWY)xxD motif
MEAPMSHQRTTIAGVALAGAVVIGAAVLTGMHGTSHAAAGPAASSNVVRSHAATVGGKSETVLTDAQGMPLYYYAPDTATRSLVSGSLAAAWPPATSTATPSATGLTGTLTVVQDSHGSQLAYNGHLLYTFVSDRRGVVTGQGVQNFFVATPNLSALTGSSTASTNIYGGYLKGDVVRG